MQYRVEYSVQFGGSIPEGLQCNQSLSLRGGEFQFVSLERDARRGDVIVVVPVDTSLLHVAPLQGSIDGTPGDPAIVVQERSTSSETMQAAIRVLSFATRVPMSCSAKFNDRLLPETSDDELVLSQLGTERIHHVLSAELEIFSLPLQVVDKVVAEKLLEREFGLTLYADALWVQQPVAKFRELWRVLESAFGQKNRVLIASLTGYGPASELGFDASELRDLLILRGRCSHAESSAGMAEYVEVSVAVGRKLKRLRCLVDEVLLTKKVWGSPTGAVDRLAHLRVVVNADGQFVIYQPDAPA